VIGTFTLRFLDLEAVTILKEGKHIKLLNHKADGKWFSNYDMCSNYEPISNN